MRTNGERIVAKLDRRSQARAGDEIDLDFNWSGVRTLDRKTGILLEQFVRLHLPVFPRLLHTITIKNAQLAAAKSWLTATTYNGA